MYLIFELREIRIRYGGLMNESHPNKSGETVTRTVINTTVSVSVNQ